MSNAILGWKNHAEAATLYSGSWQSAYPAANLQSRRLFKVARTTDAQTSSTILEIDLGAAQGIRFAGIVNHNLTAAATIRWRGATSQANLTAAPGYDGGTVNAWVSPNTPTNTADYLSSQLTLATAAQSFRWWRFDIADTGNPAGYIQIGYLVLFEAWEAVINFAPGSGFGFTPRSSAEYSLSGAKYVTRRTSRRTLDFTFQMQSQADMDTMRDIMRYVDIERPVLLIPDPNTASKWIRDAFVASMSQLPGYEYAEVIERYGLGVSLEEWLA